MKNNQEILNEFGEILISQVFDNQYIFIKNSIKNLSKTEEYKNLFSDMSAIQKNEIKNYTKEILRGTLFDFLNVFEENEEFKIIYEEDNRQVNLVKLSDMLKSELIIEGGWIDRFSKENRFLLIKCLSPTDASFSRVNMRLSCPEISLHKRI